jgi:DNA-binding IclR family transcriptional regulator
MLSTLSDAEVTALVGADAASSSAADPAGELSGLLRRLADVRERGWALDAEESWPGIVGVAVPLEGGRRATRSSPSAWDCPRVRRRAPDRGGGGRAQRRCAPAHESVQRGRPSGVSVATDRRRRECARSEHLNPTY